MVYDYFCGTFLKSFSDKTISMLYIVPTPIGNLEDITIRALRVLKEADLIAAEDTRRTGILLNHFEIHCKMLSYHEHNKFKRKDEILELLKQ
jgi:16S rRNA (cytidine1402-2'-O)-methyltransferase